MRENRDGIKLQVVGDVLVNRPEPHSAFATVREYLQKSDVTVGNLECSLNEGLSPLSYGGPHLNASPDAAPALADAGFDVLSLANNHAMDYGVAGMEATLSHLDDAGIDVIGAGWNKTDAEEPYFIEISGIELGIVAFEATTLSFKMTMQAESDRAGMNVILARPDYPNNVSKYDLRRLHSIVEETASKCDIVVALMHFGAAVDHTVSTSQRVISEAAIDAGADAVLGSHTHVLQAVDTYRGRPICFGLGHFIFDSLEYRLGMPELNQFPSVADNAVIAELDVTGEGITDIRFRPIRIDEFDPYLPTVGTPEYEQVAEVLLNISRRDGTELIKRSDHIAIPPDKL